tara:strand:+ start:4031 stop:4342 length:312 start_codon:yes stop_codon:yes gene_type:complete
MFLLSILKSNKPDKKYTATFCKCEKRNSCAGSNHLVKHFGSKGSTTYLDRKDETLKKNYIARHEVNENFNDPLTAGSLSRWLLWGPTTNLKKNIEIFKKKFKL